MKRTPIVNHVERFAVRLVELGEGHGCAALADWGRKLQERIDLFDVEGAEELLAAFPRLVERIETHNGREGV